jgi:hypothetical protein
MVLLLCQKYKYLKSKSKITQAQKNVMLFPPLQPVTKFCLNILRFHSLRDDSVCTESLKQKVNIESTQSVSLLMLIKKIVCTNLQNKVVEVSKCTLLIVL